MNFTERAFIPFILAVYVLWLLCRRDYRLCLALFLGASLVAYGYHQWELLFLLVGYCVGNWALALLIAAGRWRRGYLTLGIALNLSALVFWKYTPLFVRTLLDLAFALDLRLDMSPPHWLLPWGISFYTFTCIAYLVDVYRGDHPAERNFLRFTVFISFFPQLVAGPILRGREFLDDLQPGRLPTEPQAPLEALTLLARGAFKKMVLADRLAAAIDPFFAHVADGSTAGVWGLPYAWLYAFQIYFDFSGYTDMARGLGLLFGFRWPENFSLPYLARSVQEFWQRWHMTLSRFLRDYVYIPLGGSRLGSARTCVNLMATMLLGGLWHGASWSFLIWGGLHGTYLLLHRLWLASGLSDACGRLRGLAALVYQGLAVALTFHLVCLAWCFFRLTNFHDSLACVAKWLPADSALLFAGGSADLSVWSLLLGYGLLAWSAHMLAPSFQPVFQPGAALRAPLRTGVVWGLVLALGTLAWTLSPSGQAPAFIYFQF